jgi:Phage tail lysozyme
VRWILRGTAGATAIAVGLIVLAVIALFGGAGDCGSGVTPPSATTQTAGQIVRYFQSQGLAPFAAAGVVGNLEQESSLNPQEAGGGLAQWQGSRYGAMVAWAVGQGLDPTSTAGQLAYIAYDLKVNYAGLLAELDTAPDPGSAAADFEDVYELCNPAKCNDSARRQYAILALAAAASTTVSVSLPLGASACAASPANGAGYANPYAHTQNVRANRIDMGNDTYGTGEIDSFAQARITFAQTGIGGGWTCATQINGAVVYELLDGAYAGKFIYLAEDVIPTVRAGQIVAAGQQIATFPPNGCDEMGWEDPAAGAAGSSVLPLAETLPGFPGGPGSDQSPQALACGDSIARLLQTVGGPASHRSGAGANVTPAPMPGGYP